MSSTDMERVARRIVSLEKRHDALARARQLAASSVVLADGTSQSVADGVSAGADAAVGVGRLDGQVDDLGGVTDAEVEYSTAVPGWIEVAADQSMAAWDSTQFAVDLARELGVIVGTVSAEVAAAALVAAAAQSAADAALVEAESARSEATSKAAAAQSAAEAYALAEAEAARLAAIAAASGDATDKAAAAQAAAVAAAASDATAKAAAAEAAAKADAAAAQSTANTALSEAAAAQTAAGSAVTVANQAQATASGKSKIFRSTSAPSGTGTADGDKWEQYDSLGAGGKLSGTWAWFDGSWRSTVLSETYLPLVNIGSGTYGTLAGARLAATAIDGMVITGATVRTAATGQRVQLDATGLRAFSAAGVEKARLSADDGGLLLSGWLTSYEGGNTQRATLSGGHLTLDMPGSPSAGTLYVGPSYITAAAAGTPLTIEHVAEGPNSDIQINAGKNNKIRMLSPVEFQGDTDWIQLPLGAGFTFGAGGYARCRIKGGLFFLHVRDAKPSSSGAATMLDLSSQIIPDVEIPLAFSTSSAGVASHPAWISSGGGLVRATWVGGTNYRINCPPIPIN